MIPVVAIGSLKSSGSTTVAMTLASVTSAAGIPTTLIDAARDADASHWASKRVPSVPTCLHVVRERLAGEIERMIRGARRRGEAVIVDCGSDPETLLFVEKLADRMLVPVRFSPLSAAAAIATDRLFDEAAGLGRPGRRRAFVASAITPIHSRVARAVETMIEASETRRLSVGLALRSAYEAPFLFGASLFSLDDWQAPGLDRARAEAAMLAYEVGLLGAGADERAPQDGRPAYGQRFAA